MTLLKSESARPWSPSPLSLPLVFHFFIFNSEKQIRVLFEKNSKTWFEMKEIVATILQTNVTNLDFLDSFTLNNIDHKDDNSYEIVNKLAVYSCIVKNNQNEVNMSLPSLTIYDANDKEIMHLSKPYLFRSKA